MKGSGAGAFCGFFKGPTKETSKKKQTELMFEVQNKGKDLLQEKQLKDILYNWNVSFMNKYQSLKIFFFSDLKMSIKQLQSEQVSESEQIW